MKARSMAGFSTVTRRPAPLALSINTPLSNSGCKRWRRDEDDKRLAGTPPVLSSSDRSVANASSALVLAIHCLTRNTLPPDTPLRIDNSSILGRKIHEIEVFRHGHRDRTCEYWTEPKIVGQCHDLPEIAWINLVRLIDIERHQIRLAVTHDCFDQHDVYQCLDHHRRAIGLNDR